jgi:hypothetical protein
MWRTIAEPNPVPPTARFAGADARVRCWAGDRSSEHQGAAASSGCSGTNGGQYLAQDRGLAAVILHFATRRSRRCGRWRRAIPSAAARRPHRHRTRRVGGVGAPHLLLRIGYNLRTWQKFGDRQRRKRSSSAALLRGQSRLPICLAGKPLGAQPQRDRNGDQHRNDRQGRRGANRRPNLLFLGRARVVPQHESVEARRLEPGASGATMRMGSWKCYSVSVADIESRPTGRQQPDLPAF